MELSNAAKWTLFNRLITAGAMLLGTALAVFGFVLGFWGSIETLLIDGNVQTAVESANPVITLALAALGFLVWQIGKTYALFWSLPRASGRAAAKRFDHGRLKSEVVEALDERLAEMEEDVAETRRSVQELKRSEHAAAFDESDVLESEIAQRTESVGTPQARSSESRSSEQAASSTDAERTPTDDRNPRDERTDQPAERTSDRHSQPTGTQPQTTGTQEQAGNTNTQPQASGTESRSNTPEPTQTETQVVDHSASEEPTEPTDRSQTTSTEQSQTDRHTAQTDRHTQAQSQDRAVGDGTGQSTTDEPTESGFEFSNAGDSAPEQADDERSSSEPAPEETDRSETTDTDEDASSSDSEDPLA